MTPAEQTAVMWVIIGGFTAAVGWATIRDTWRAHKRARAVLNQADTDAAHWADVRDMLDRPEGKQ